MFTLNRTFNTRYTCLHSEDYKTNYRNLTPRPHVCGHSLGNTQESPWDSFTGQSVYYTVFTANSSPQKDNFPFKSRWMGGVSRVLHPTRHIIGHFGDEPFQAITCAGTENSKQSGENTPKTQNKQTLRPG